MEAKTEFDRLMREAVAIKSAQLAQYRKKFDLWPQFHQAGLYYSDSFANMRESTLEEKVPVYETKKKEGTDLFSAGDYQGALHKYEETLTLFRWVKNRNEKWRNSGIEDDDLTIEYVEVNDQSKEMMIALYLNIALCNLKLETWKEAIAACDEALILDNQNVKALYRKAVALTLPAGSDLDDYRTGIKLLSEALKYDPTNAMVRQKLVEFQDFLHEQKKKSKETFHSFFKKPAYEDAQPEKNTNAVKEYQDLIEKGENMVKDLKSHGKDSEAKKLEKNVTLMKKYKEKALNEAKKKTLDFDNPTEEMKKNAKEFGIDLDDPIVKAELNKLKNRKADELSSDEEENKVQEKSSKGILKPGRSRDMVIEKESWFSWKMWLLGLAVMIFGIYWYTPNETELW
jgi:hypothetical protein